MAEVITKKGVPLIVVVMPVIPEGALLRGISVELWTTTKGVPFIVVVSRCPVGVAWI